MSSFPPFIPGSAFITNGLISTFNSNTLGNLFTTGGNVGIATTNPAFRLDVNGSVDVSSFRGTNLSVNNVSTGVLIASSGITAANINFTGTLSQNGVPYSPGGSQWTTTNGNIFYTGGNVGIYVTAPSTALHVSGGAIITGALSAGSLSVSNFRTTNVTTSSLRTSQMVVNSRNLKSETTAVTNALATRVSQLSWNSRSATSNNWTSVCWSPELHLFCAVADSGTGNRVMTSPDGITWTTRTSTANDPWYSVCWSPELGLFCAVGNWWFGNGVMTSSNGITWVNRIPGAYNSWRSVCWSPELGLFCAVAESGTGNRVMTSPDGITWTARASAADNGWRSVAWAPELGLFCAVGQGTGNRVMSSPDGITWTTRASAANSQWSSICWSSELYLFCAVSNDAAGAAKCVTSPDGITWTTRQSGGGQINAVCWSPELSLFCTVQSTNNNYSSDGINWTIFGHNAAPSFTSWGSICWAPELGIFCAVAYSGSGNRVMTSRDVGLYRPRKVNPRYTLTHSNVNSTAITTTNILSTNVTTSSIVLTSGSLNATFNTNTMGNIFTTGGNVGIGNTAPSATLDISSSNTFGNIYLGNTIQNRKLVLWSNANNPVDYIGLGVEADTFRYNIGNGGSHVFNIGNTNGSTSKQVFSVGRTSAVYGTSMQIAVPQTSYFMLGSDSVGKDGSAGVIGYSIFGTNAVEIVGCGTAPGNRTINLYDNVVVSGSVSKASGTFDIKHPIEEKANAGTRLIHSFIEGPRCDLIYRGKVQLVNGTATVNINEGCVAESDCVMSSGTFETLVANPQIILQNNVTFDGVTGVIDGAILTITCENPNANMMIEWTVIGERKDPYIKEWDKTNANGYLKTEYISSQSTSITI